MSEEKFWINELRKQRKKKNLHLRIQSRRFKYLAVAYMLIFIMLILRLFYIQVLKSDDFSQRAVQQRMITIPLSVARGGIYDRNLIPFTDREVKKVVIAYPEYIFDKASAVEVISRACGIEPDKVRSRLDTDAGAVEFISTNSSGEQLSVIESGRINGVLAVEKKVRYAEKPIAAHVIGFINKSDKKGQMGLEKSMNSFLAGAGADSIVAVVDSSKNIIPGLGFRKVDASDNGESYSIKLTLDYYIQAIAEEVLEKNKINGAAVVMDIKNGDILAMASSPEFDQNDLGKYMQNEGSELINKAVWQFDLGSIFKTVVAAAALESGLIDSDATYICKGSIEIGNSVIKCSTHKTHENVEINMADAFALSCNTSFVNIGTQIGAENILKMAEKLGFGQKQCHMLPEEKSGYLPTVLEDGIGNISIGQGKIQVTPLQVANMMATIANGGIMHEPRLVDELVDSEGSTVKRMDRTKPTVVLSYRTVTKLREMLAMVTDIGTGMQANMDEYGGSSGKTSSAETGIRSGEVVHGWFAGYVPSNNPQYSIAVFVYDGQSGGKSAAPIFREIASSILNKYKR
ncbi:MAG: peptidoglycan D,D-transpeptidase FtsI family protein [Bacillota bacterium]